MLFMDYIVLHGRLFFFFYVLYIQAFCCFIGFFLITLIKDLNVICTITEHVEIHFFSLFGSIFLFYSQSGFVDSTF